MEWLETEIPAIAAEFKKRNFEVKKNNNNLAFSSLPVDQTHEQNNNIIKGDGGAIGLTASSSQFLARNVRNNQRFRVVPGMVILRDFLVSRSRVFPLFVISVWEAQV